MDVHFLNDNGQVVAEALQRGDAIVIAYGLFKDQKGTVAYYLKGQTSLGQIVGVNITMGLTADQSSL